MGSAESSASATEDDEVFTAAELALIKRIYELDPASLRTHLGAKHALLRGYGSALLKEHSGSFDTFHTLATNLLRSTPSVVLQTCFNACVSGQQQEAQDRKGHDDDGTIDAKSAENADGSCINNNLRFLLLVTELSVPYGSEHTGRELKIARKLHHFVSSHLPSLTTTGAVIKEEIDVIKSSVMREYVYLAHVGYIAFYAILYYIYVTSQLSIHDTEANTSILSLSLSHTHTYTP